MSKQDPNLHLNYGWEFRESGWNIGIDNNLLKLGAIVHLSVIADNLVIPPSSPNEGDRYIVHEGAYDVWLGHERKIAVRRDGIWNFYVPEEGWLCWVKNRKVLRVYTDLVWEDLVSL